MCVWDIKRKTFSSYVQQRKFQGHIHVTGKLLLARIYNAQDVRILSKQYILFTVCVPWVLALESLMLTQVVQHSHPQEVWVETGSVLVILWVEFQTYSV